MSKLSSETKKVATETQQLVLDGLGSKAAMSLTRRWPGVSAIAAIAETNDVALSSLGETGKKLKEFAVKTNHIHPDMESWMGDDSRCESLYAAALSCIQTNKPESSLLEKSKDCLGVISYLQKPSPRILRNEYREEARKIKKDVRNLSMRRVYSEGENCFYDQPDNFKRFCRNSKYYIEETKEFVERCDVFKRHGMEELAHACEKRIRSLEESLKPCMGFYRLHPEQAAVILARFHNFKWNDSQNNIIIPPKFFEGYYFWPEDRKLSEDDLLAEELREMQNADNIKKSMIVSTRFISSPFGLLSFVYQPRIYPLQKFGLELPYNVKKVVNQAESCHDFVGGAVFDYYWVLVPGVSLAHPLLTSPKDHWTIRDGEHNYVFPDIMSASAKLDQQLVRDEHIMPVVLGDRDGKCYFLCMWQ